MAIPKFVGLALGAAWIAGCSGDGVTDPSAMHSIEPAFVAGSPVDISGGWTWSKTERLTFPAWVAQGLFGVEPEGPVTRATCESAGTMTLSQAGATFTGEMLTTEQACVTTGGQPFLEGGGAFADPVTDGRIRGQSIVMERFVNGVACTYHAVASDIQGGAASLLDGGANCLVPGHPHNPLPLDPPPGGTNVVVAWTAVRQ